MQAHLSIRVVPDRVFNGYVWPLGAWAVGLLFLYANQTTPFGLWLLYPLAVWYGLLSLWWAVGLHRLRARDEVTDPEIRAGVRSVGRFMAGASVSPALVFMVMDPISPSTWGTCAGIGILGAIAWVAVNLLPNLNRRSANWVAVAIAWAALPINATGALSLATWLGWFGGVRQVVGV